MKLLVTALLLFSVRSFAACPEVHGNSNPDSWIKSNTYWIFYYVTRMNSLDNPKVYEGTMVVTTKHNQEVFREEKVTGVDDWYSTFKVEGQKAGFSYDSYTGEEGSAWIEVNDQKTVLDPIEIETAKFTPIVCP